MTEFEEAKVAADPEVEVRYHITLIFCLALPLSLLQLLSASLCGLYSMSGIMVSQCPFARSCVVALSHVALELGYWASKT